MGFLKKVFFLILNFCFSLLLFSNNDTIPLWKVPFIDQNVKIDGVLNEPAYRQAYKYDNFFQISPGYNIKPSEKTELYIFSNTRGLVLGIVCHDKTGSISRSKYRRDEPYSQDGVTVALDCEGNAKKFYVLGISPTNCVFDGLNDGGIFNLDFDFDFEHATKIYKDKYVIEVLIPYSSFSFPVKNKQKWILSVSRDIAREVIETDTLWKDVRDSADPRVTMVYIQFTIPQKIKVANKKTLKLIPSLVISHLKHKEEFFGQKDNFSSDKGDLGLTVEYSPSSNTTMKAAIHPDFSQVEADDTYQRVNNRYPVYLREKRPFFMDGMESFSTPFELLYTRRIVKPEYGLKFSTKIKNRYGLYLISAMEKDVPSERFGYENDFEKDVYWNVIRSTYNLDNKGSFLGFMAIQRNYGSDFNRVISGDGNIVFKKLTFSFQGVITTLNQGEKTETGNAVDLSLDYLFNDYVSAGLSYDGISPDFRDDAGFFQRKDIKSYSSYLNLRYKPVKDTGLISSATLMFLAVNNYNYSSQLFDQISQITFFMNTKHRIFLFVNFHKNSNLRYLDKVFETHSTSVNINWSEHSYFSPGLFFWTGTDVLYGDNPVLVDVKANSFGFSSRFSKFSLRVSFFVYRFKDRETHETIRKQNSLEVVGTYFFNDHTNFKVFYISDLADIRDYNYNEPYHYINLLFTWRKNAFTKFYIGYNNGHSTYRLTDKTMWGFEQDKYFYAKITYLF